MIFETALPFEGSKASPVCPSGNRNIQMNMEHWRSDNDRERRKYSEKKPVPAPYHILARTETESNPGLRGERPASSFLSHGNNNNNNNNNNMIHKVNLKNI